MALNGPKIIPWFHSLMASDEASEGHLWISPFGNKTLENARIDIICRKPIAELETVDEWHKCADMIHKITAKLNAT